MSGMTNHALIPLQRRFAIWRRKRSRGTHIPAELSGINPFDYLTELLRHPREVADNSDAWLPWNYRKALKRTA